MSISIVERSRNGGGGKVFKRNQRDRGRKEFITIQENLDCNLKRKKRDLYKFSLSSTSVTCNVIFDMIETNERLTWNLHRGSEKKTC